MSGESVIKASNVTKTFGTGRALVKAVSDVSINVDRGEIVMIMGPSGSGKTTLLTMIGALLTPSGGDIYVNGIKVSGGNIGKLSRFRLNNIGFIFQSFNLLSALTAVDNVAVISVLAGKRRKKAREDALTILDDLDLSDRAYHLPGELSGGERQRVSLARALINDPVLLLADEPTANLDSRAGHKVMEILKKIAKSEGRTVVIVSHDMRIMDICDRVIWLEDGMIKEKAVEIVIDPVCGMKLRTDQVFYKSYYGRREFHFCSKRDKASFDEDPEKFV